VVLSSLAVLLVYYNQLELLLLILVCIHMSYLVYFGEKCSADSHGNSFRLVLESHEKVMENDFWPTVLCKGRAYVIACSLASVCRRRRL